MTTLIIALTIYFFSIIVFSSKKSSKIESPTLNLFKSMFPSWKFFDESVDTPVLLYRTVGPEQNLENFSDWKICIPHPEKKWFHFFINPEGNFYLAYLSHIQQLLGELDACPDELLDSFHQQITYKLTENFVRFDLLKQSGILDMSYFQFKISSIVIVKNHFQVKEDILISPTLQLHQGES